MEYRVKLEPDSNDTTLATFPDLPGATFGDNEADALGHARDALETILEAYIKDRKPIPEPSKGPGPRLRVPALLAAKIALHNEMLKQGVNKSELARRLDQHLPQIDRLVDVRHGSKLDQLEAAFSALGKCLDITVSDAPRAARSAGIARSTSGRARKRSQERRRRRKSAARI